MKSQNQDKGKRFAWLRKHRLAVVPVLLIIVIVLGTLLYSQRQAIYAVLTNSHQADNTPGVAKLVLPPGFQISVFASGLSAPRFIAFDPSGVLFVAESGAGNIVALPDPNHTGRAASKKVVASGLNDPTSLDFYQGALYIGETNAVTRLDLGSDLQVTSRKALVSLPESGQHVTRTVLIGSDSRLYVSIGSTCNVCVESDPHRAAVWVYNLDGSDGHLYARGLRNAVGLAINPWNQQIWATNNGRDEMGDNLPPDTIYALQDGGNYGWPYCHAGDIVDPDMGHPGSCDGVIAPLVKLQAHSAPLGLAFYNATQFPSQYRGLFIAYHGSWNRSVLTGYKVVFVPLNNQGQVSGPARDFITGWLLNGKTSGRPVGLAIGPDGSLYVSDDDAGIIYRVTYTG